MAGNVSPAFRSRSRAAARRGEQLGPVVCPGTCWEQFRARRRVGNGLGSFVAWVRFHPFVPFHAAKGVWRSCLGAVPFSSTRRGTFPLRFVAAHVLQHGAGNNWPRLCARGRAEERFWCWAHGKICVLPTIQTSRGDGLWFACMLMGRRRVCPRRRRGWRWRCGRKCRGGGRHNRRTGWRRS